MKWIYLAFLLALHTPLFCQGVVHNHTPIQWMPFGGGEVMMVQGWARGDETVTLYFSNGTTFVVPGPALERTKLVDSQYMLTEDGIELITKRYTTTFGPEEEIEKRPLLQFYSISYDDIKEGKKEWVLKREIRVSGIGFQIMPINDKYYLGCFSGGAGIRARNTQVYDWIVYTFNDSSHFVEHDYGHWLDSESFFFDSTANKYVSRYKTLTSAWNSPVVHTKNYLTIANHWTGRMLVFSKETGKLVRRLKLTNTVPEIVDSESGICDAPITIVQPDMEDGLVVLARTDKALEESIKVYATRKRLRDSGIPGAEEVTSEIFEKSRQDAQWYRINLKNGKISKLHSPDVPTTWDHYMLAPIFIPYLNEQILFGGLKKGYGQLIGEVFKNEGDTNPERDMSKPVLDF
ncbi:MAG: hypothetical protein FWG02_11875 [Holophagaceae bacterium]|nr:hypothetical protein [Holophagaceae bacterium]